MKNMTLYLAIGGGVLVLAAASLIYWLHHRPAKLKTEYYQEKWKELQGMLRDKQKWALAVVDADNLLDSALKKKHISGHSMGERLVKAQRMFTDNDGIWFGHKLRNKIDADPTVKLKEAEVKQALVGIRQGLKDVGALPNGQSVHS